MFLTSNNVRDLGDALKRRCLHLHIPLPDAHLEERIVATRVPGVEARLTRELVAFVQSLRDIDLRKLPSISETVDWARALVLLHAHALEPDLVRETLNVLLKFEQDIVAVEPKIGELSGPGGRGQRRRVGRPGRARPGDRRGVHQGAAGLGGARLAGRGHRRPPRR